MNDQIHTPGEGTSLVQVVSLSDERAGDCAKTRKRIRELFFPSDEFTCTTDRGIYITSFLRAWKMSIETGRPRVSSLVFERMVRESERKRERTTDDFFVLHMQSRVR